MDALAALQAEIQKKRKATLGAPSSSASSAQRPAKRWRSLAEIEREQQREYRRCEEEAEQARKSKRSQSAEGDASANHPASKARTRETEATRNAESKQRAPISQQTSVSEPRVVDPPLKTSDVIRRLRALKQPVTLFGENAWERFHRLRDLQIAQEDQSDGQRNVYQKKMREVRAKHAEEDVYAYTGARLPALSSKRGEDDVHKERDDLKDGVEKGTHCKEDYVHGAIRKYIRLWSGEIDALSKEDRRSYKGRSQLVMYEQTKVWLEPLEKLLRRRKLSKTILSALRDIFEAAAQREYMLAMRLYLERLAIGNSPWPMGATQVGIHSRAAREKIGEDKIAHVMNDEQTRKYIQAVKRLLTVAQRHFPTDDSKKFLS